MQAQFHVAGDERPTRATIFLHEDIIARTLAYELEVYQWRIDELKAGRGDPGRPTFQQVRSSSFIHWQYLASPILQAFGGMPITQHRYHAAFNMFPISRNIGTPRNDKIYYHEDCPGIDDLTSINNFPVIDTLLSIPFSLLHTVPRLAGIVPLSVYQQQLITMGTEIIRLWWWKPSPKLIEELQRMRTPSHQSNLNRSPAPKCISHPSRLGTTFSSMEPITMRGNPTTPTTHSSDCDPNQDVPTFDLPSGQVFLGMAPSVSWDGDGLLLTARDEGLVEMADVLHANKSTSLPTHNVQTKTLDGQTETLDGRTETLDQSIMGMEDSDNKDVKVKPLTCLSSLDIQVWSKKVAGSVPEPLPPSLTPGSFERGNIGGLSTNDILMIKGLIHPPVYVQFFDLSSFSQL